MEVKAAKPRFKSWDLHGERREPTPAGSPTQRDKWSRLIEPGIYKTHLIMELFFTVESLLLLYRTLRAKVGLEKP